MKFHPWKTIATTLLGMAWWTFVRDFFANLSPADLPNVFGISIIAACFIYLVWHTDWDEIGEALSDSGNDTCML